MQEQLRVTTRMIDTGRGVRIHKTVTQTPHLVEQSLLQDEWTIEHVACDTIVDPDRPPTVRYDGPTLVVPVLEEVLEVHTRLRLKEEIRVTQIRRPVLARQTVMLKSEQVEIERFDAPIQTTAPDTMPAAGTEQAGETNATGEHMMMNTVIAVYDNFAQAESALKQLLTSGFTTLEARLRPPQDTAEARQAALRAAGITDAEQQAEGGSIRSFFRELFGGEPRHEQADRYAEAIRRGSFVLTVDARDEQQRETATAILDQFQPVDIDERAAQWQSAGWTGHDEHAALLSDEEVARERSQYRSSERSPTGEQAAIPVIEEELKVGKRAVQRGGVRVFQRIIETPVQETVALREEHVTVERHPVDAPATSADFAALKEGTVEVREMAEEPVVSKTARVVEEVVVGKEITEREQTVSDTVRHTEVDVEQIDTPITPATSATPAPPVGRPGGERPEHRP